MVNLENLMLKGIKQKADPDILTVYEYHPEVIDGFIKVVNKLKLNNKFYWIDKTKQPEHNELITSGYRDYCPPNGAKNSPHFFAAALDLVAPTLEDQIWFAIAALSDGFRRAGLYPFSGIVHIDICDYDWQKKYGGTPAWVMDRNGKYHGFQTLYEATEYAKKIVDLSEKGG